MSLTHERQLLIQSWRFLLEVEDRLHLIIEAIISMVQTDNRPENAQNGTVSDLDKNEDILTALRPL
jgi:hypothetical protein